MSMDVDVEGALAAADFAEAYYESTSRAQKYLVVLAAEVRGLNEELGRFAETNAQLAKELYEATHRSTRELLEELRRRGEVRAVIDGEPQWAVPALIADVAASILNEMPDALLDYRTVEGS